MGAFQLLSANTIKALKSSNQKIDLTPWDLQFLLASTNKRGLLYHHPLASDQIQRLRHSLTSALSFFQPLAGRLKITEHRDNTVSCSVTCNNAGVTFIHAASKNTCVADILEPTYVPSVVRSFFPFIGVRNYEGTSKPLLAVQVTELVDGIFIGCTFNHVAGDGNSTWNFINSWAEISRGGCQRQISKPPILERWFPNGIQHPIRFPFTMEPQNHSDSLSFSSSDNEKLSLSPQNHSDSLSFSSSDNEKLSLSERIFRFPKEKIEQLKLKVNAEINDTIKISSLQAVLTHLWRSVICSKHLNPQEEVYNMFVIGVRQRFDPQLPEEYFGNAIIPCGVKMKAGDLLEEGGLGKGAWEMNKLIASYSNEKLKNHYESWLRNPSFITSASMINKDFLATSSSPWFNVYGNDFGWGKPVAVRSGNNNVNGFVSAFSGIEEGSINLQVCLPYKILEAMGNDHEFMEIVSN